LTKKNFFKNLPAEKKISAAGAGTTKKKFFWKNHTCFLGQSPMGNPFLKEFFDFEEKIQKHFGAERRGGNDRTSERLECYFLGLIQKPGLWGGEYHTHFSLPWEASGPKVNSTGGFFIPHVANRRRYSRA
jgi:hypothetical protein